MKLQYKLIGYNFFFLTFILSIPHTTAIRNILFYSLLLLLSYVFFKQKVYKSNIFNNEKFITLKKIYILISLWIIFGLIFLSDNQTKVLAEFKTYWIVPFLYLYFAFVAFIIAYKENKKFVQYLLSLIFVGLFIHCLYIDLYAVQHFIEHNELIRRFGGLEGTPTKANYLTSLLLGLAFSEIVYRIKTSKRFLIFDNFSIIIFLVLILFSAVIEALRNGSISILFLITSSLFLTLYKSKYSKVFKLSIISIFVLLLSFPLYNSIQKDSRWSNLIETIPIAWNTKNSKYWLDRHKFEAPKLANGSIVNDSNYVRIAWIKEGFIFALEHPFGIGHQRNSFGHAMQNKYGYNIRSTSHSGFIDWLIGIGFLGMAILYYLIYKVLQYSFIVYFKEYNYYSIALIFIIAGTFSRFLVDPNLRDHMFLTFMLVVGFLLAGLFTTDEKIKTN